MKFGHLIEYTQRNIFIKNDGESEAGRLVPELFLICENALYDVKASCLQLRSIYSIALSFAYNKNKLCKILDY